MNTPTHTYNTREDFILEACLRIHAAREANPDFDRVAGVRSFEIACELADLAENKGIAPWLRTPNAAVNR